MSTVCIGYFNNSKNHYPEYPFPVEQQPYDNSKFVQMIKFIFEKAYPIYSKGFSVCRLCKCKNGSVEYQINLQNTTYIIPGGYLHYVEKHFIQVDPLIQEIFDKLTGN